MCPVVKAEQLWRCRCCGEHYRDFDEAVSCCGPELVSVSVESCECCGKIRGRVVAGIV